MARLNATDKKAALEEKRKQIEVQLRDLSAREREEARKSDTRRKVIAGALALEHMENHASGQWAAEFRDVLAKAVDDRARHLFPFLDAVPAKPNTKKTETAADGSSKDVATTAVK